MNKKLIDFKTGLITLYYRETDKEFNGSLLLKSQMSPANEYEVESMAEKTFTLNQKQKIFEKYFSLIDFPLLFNFLSYKLKIVIEKLNFGFLKGRLFLRGLAIACLAISFLSLSSILLPLSVAQINSSIRKSNIVVQPTDPPKLDEKEETAKKLAVDPSKDILVFDKFKLSVPKIGLESEISPNVDLQDEKVYRQELLSTGVAHAKGSYLPGQKGTVFVFAHSTDSVFNIAKFNAKFFSLGDLEAGDEIKIDYKNKEYRYKVSGRTIVNPDQVDYIRELGNALVLMTCTPPGTDWQRLLIFADQVNTP